MIHSLLKKLGFQIVIRRYEAILISSTLLLTGAVMPSNWEPPFRLQQLQQIPLPKLIQPPATPQRPWIALTFDDGPHADKTERLLAVLKEAKVPATFFVVGKMADRYPQIMRQIAEDGHELANHTYSHPNLSKLSDSQVLKELKQTREVVRKLTGQDAYLFRPPGGDFSRRIVKLTSKAGYKMVLWSVLVHDVDGAKPKVMRQRVLRHAEDGAIVLMHSGMTNTIEMLPQTIADLRQRGYHFVTISTLMGLTPGKPVPSQNPPAPTASAQVY
jgi:peptidoglycan-N-acetylglucosamine deacetylase